MAKTKIPWATDVWNPVTGCDPVSEGCAHCYAKRMATRLAGRCGYDKADPFRVTWHWKRLEEPYTWRKPRRVFVCSMGDFFHPEVRDDWRETILQTMWWANGEHTYMVLTKRPEEAKAFFGRIKSDEAWMAWKKLWLGVTAESQQRWDARVPVLMSIPAELHFVSCEPLLGPIEIRGQRTEDRGQHGEVATDPHGQTRTKTPEWIIAGPETGPRKRECRGEWIEGIREQCGWRGIPFFDKREGGGPRNRP